MHYAARCHAQARRFVSSRPVCGPANVVEQFPNLAQARARRTHRQISRLSAIAKELGGRPGTRESANACMPASRHTLLRLLRRASIVAASPPRVLGVDDWAMCKGHTYGTIMGDVERHRIVDMLPDRPAESFAAWFGEHPGIEVIS